MVNKLEFHTKLTSVKAWLQAELQGFCTVGAMLLLQSYIHELLQHAAAWAKYLARFEATILQLLAADCSLFCQAPQQSVTIRHEICYPESITFSPTPTCTMI
jgi:hypothetical protein